MEITPESNLEDIFRILPVQKKALERLGIATARDLLLHLPSRYIAEGETKNISDLVVGENVTIYGQVVKVKITKAYRKKIPLSEAVIEDATGKIKAVWFHQAYMVKKFPEGSWIRVSGKVTDRKGDIYIANPQVGDNVTGKSEANSLFVGENKKITGFSAVYKETRGLTSNWIRHSVERLLGARVHEQIPELIPDEILEKYNLPGITTSLVWIHTPQKEADALSARKRFSFEEVFSIQIKRLKAREEYRKSGGYKIEKNEKDVSEFISRFPFKFTEAQDKSVSDILDDMSSGQPMTRLLEGDVGSGKTAVAASTAFSVVKAGLQVAYMAPTEILAKQHFESFIELFRHMPVQIGFISGKQCFKFPSKLDPNGYTNISRTQLLKWVANGEIPILIGTHALIQKSVEFEDLAYVIIDEQHRFGVMQRSKLVKKDAQKAPHLLSMTATPIPRTLALTVYGDLDLTVIDQMPAGRKEIETKIVPPDERDGVYKKMREELETGRQAYVICPRIDEPDPNKAFAIRTKSAKAEQARLKKEVFPDREIGILHSKMKPKAKEEEMQAFLDREIDILVATSVVEVGVNVPNATSIIIEGAERFGLSQLHQLRGRVLRSNHQAYCYLFTDSKSAITKDRLKAIEKAKNGFELAELDLKLRGSGSLSGEKQWGLSDIGMEALQNLKMVEAARTEAREILKQDPELKKYPELLDKITSTEKIIHFE